MGLRALLQGWLYLLTTLIFERSVHKHNVRPIRLVIYLAFSLGTGNNSQVNVVDKSQEIEFIGIYFSGRVLSL
jgi:hypothetical protein